MLCLLLHSKCVLDLVPKYLQLYTVIDGFHSMFSLWQLEGITSPCCLLITSHDLFALQFLWWRMIWNPSILSTSAHPSHTLALYCGYRPYYNVISKIEPRPYSWIRCITQIWPYEKSGWVMWLDCLSNGIFYASDIRPRVFHHHSEYSGGPRLH